jgi:hypothetical protein
MRDASIGNFFFHRSLWRVGGCCLPTFTSRGVSRRSASVDYFESFVPPPLPRGNVTIDCDHKICRCIAHSLEHERTTALLHRGNILALL